MSPMHNRGLGSLNMGNPNALLYDTREHRTKTAVTAVLKGTKVITLLRSYDSRKEPAPDVNCTIWQAGRATSATQMAFKPIQIGQSVYLDEGAGKYNPSPQILDEAVQNEWPGREVGIFVSVGTGKRPAGTSKNSHEWWEDFLGGSSMSEFAEARRRLIAKIEGCEESHKYMLREHLAARQVNPENYVRLNVEVGVGELGMNEWHRISEMTTNTRSYLAQRDVQALSLNAASKLAKIHFQKVRHDRAEARKNAGHDGPQYGQAWQQYQNPWDRPLANGPPPQNFAVELPGDMPAPGQQQQPHYPMGPDSYNAYMHRRPSTADHKYSLNGDGYDLPQQQSYSSPQLPSAHPSLDYQNSVRFSQDSYDPSPRQSQDFQRTSPPPPPVPPKTPTNAAVGGLPYPDSSPPQAPPRTFMNMGELGRRLPYPDTDQPPPAVNMANKPTFTQ